MAGLTDFLASLDSTAAPPGNSEWVRYGAIEINSRTGQRRPVGIPGAKPGLEGPEDRELQGDGLLSRAAWRALAGAGSAWPAAVEASESLHASAPRSIVQNLLLGQALPAAGIAATAALLPRPNEETLESARKYEGYRQIAQDRFVEAATESGAPPTLSAFADTFLEAPDAFTGAGAAAKGAVGALRLSQAARAVRAADAQIAQPLRRIAGEGAEAAPAPTNVRPLVEREVAKETSQSQAVLGRRIEEARQSAVQPLDKDPSESILKGLRIEKEGRAKGDPFQFSGGWSKGIPEEHVDDVVNYVRDNAEKLEEFRRGTQHWKKFDNPAKIAEDLGIDPEKLVKMARPGMARSDDEIGILHSLYKMKASQQTALAKKIVEEGGGTEVQIARLKLLEEEVAATLKATIGAHSEAGRALNATKAIVEGMEPASKFRLQLAKHYAGKLDDQHIRALATLDPAKPGEVAAWVRAVDSPRFKELMQTWLRSSVLTGAPTHIRNIVNNAGHAVERQILDRMGMAALSKALPEDQRVYFREATAAGTGLVMGMGQGLGKAFRVMRYGPGPEAQKFMEGFRIYNPFLKVENPIARNLGYYSTEPSFRALASADAFFSSVVETSEIYALATRDALRKGLRGKEKADRIAELVTKPTTEMIAAARDAALAATYMDDPASWVSRIASGLNDGPLWPMVLFVRTPSRIFKRMIERSGAGVVTGSVHLYKRNQAIKAALDAGETVNVKDLPHPDALGELTRGLMGVGTMAAGYSWMMQGNMTGPAPKDREARDAFFRAGYRPWHIRLPGTDQWFDYRQMGTLAAPLALMGSIASARADRKDDTALLDHYASIAARLGTFWMDQSTMATMSQFIESMNTGQENPGIAGKYFGYQAASFLPASGYQRTIANLADRAAGGGSRLVDTQGFGPAFSANVPGLRNQLPPRRNALGEEISIPLSQVMFAGTPLNMYNRGITDPVEQELDRLGVEITFPADTKAVDLGYISSEDYDLAARRETKAMIRRYMETVYEGELAWPKLTDEQKREAIKQATYEAREEAEKRLMARGKAAATNP